MKALGLPHAIQTWVEESKGSMKNTFAPTKPLYASTELRGDHKTVIKLKRIRSPSVLRLNDGIKLSWRRWRLFSRQQFQRNSLIGLHESKLIDQMFLAVNHAYHCTRKYDNDWSPTASQNMRNCSIIM